MTVYDVHLFGGSLRALNLAIIDVHFVHTCKVWALVRSFRTSKTNSPIETRAWARAKCAGNSCSRYCNLNITDYHRMEPTRLHRHETIFSSYKQAQRVVKSRCFSCIPTVQMVDLSQRLGKRHHRTRASFLLGMAVHIVVEISMPRYGRYYRCEIKSFGSINSSTHNPR